VWGDCGEMRGILWFGRTAVDGVCCGFFVRSFVCSSVRSFVRPRFSLPFFVRSFVRSSVRPSVRSFVRSFLLLRFCREDFTSFAASKASQFVEWLLTTKGGAEGVGVGVVRVDSVLTCVRACVRACLFVCLLADDTPRPVLHCTYQM